MGLRSLQEELQQRNTQNLALAENLVIAIQEKVRLEIILNKLLDRILASDTVGEIQRSDEFSDVRLRMRQKTGHDTLETFEG